MREVQIRWECGWRCVRSRDAYRQHQGKVEQRDRVEEHILADDEGDHGREAKHHKQPADGHHHTPEGDEIEPLTVSSSARKDRGQRLDPARLTGPVHAHAPSSR